jgi:hypothetical protein
MLVSMHRVEISRERDLAAARTQERADSRIASPPIAAAEVVIAAIFT